MCGKCIKKTFLSRQFSDFCTRRDSWVFPAAGLLKYNQANCQSHRPTSCPGTVFLCLPKKKNRIKPTEINSQKKPQNKYFPCCLISQHTIDNHAIIYVASRMQTHRHPAQERRDNYGPTEQFLIFDFNSGSSRRTSTNLLFSRRVCFYRPTITQRRSLLLRFYSNRLVL